MGGRGGAIVVGLRTKLAFAWFGLVLLAFCPGCHGLARKAGLRRAATAAYETVHASPNRQLSVAQTLTDEAIEQIAQCEWCEAQETLQQALGADVSYGPAHNNLGKVYYAQRKYYLAAWEFEYAIKSMPERAEPHNNLGLVYEAVGRTEEAIEQYQAAHALKPTDPNAIGNLARVLLRQDPNDEVAMDLLRELILYDTRPNWVYWARERLGLHRGEAVVMANDEEEELPRPSGYSPSFAPEPISTDDDEFIPHSGETEEILELSPPKSSRRSFRLPADVDRI